MNIFACNLHITFLEMYISLPCGDQGRSQAKSEYGPDSRRSISRPFDRV